MKFEIKVRGILDENWSEWLDTVTMIRAIENEVMITIICGEAPDQPALYGILDHLRDLNLPLISAIQVE